MQNPNKFLFSPSKPSSKAAALLLSISIISGCGKYGDPSIVSQVPAQVDYKKVQAEYDAGNPSLWPEHYYFGLEQCPKDIKLAEAGQQIDHPSFNAATHTYSPDCFIQQVEVPQDVYNRYSEGSTIVFEGLVGQPITRVS